MTTPAKPIASTLSRGDGLLIGKGGLYGHIVRLAPMLNTTKADVDDAIKLLDKSFSEVRN